MSIIISPILIFGLIQKNLIIYPIHSEKNCYSIQVEMDIFKFEKDNSGQIIRFQQIALVCPILVDIIFLNCISFWFIRFF